MGNQQSNRVQNAINLTKDICNVANIYKSCLIGNTFMYVFEGRYIEVTFRTRDFLHLTGVESKLGAKDFYKNAVNGRLRHEQIYFSQRHPYSLSLKKVKQLANIEKLTSEDLFIVENLVTQTAVFKFGVTDLDFTICIKQVYDDNGILTSDCYVPISLRVEDSFSRGSQAFEVNLILKKKNDEPLYTEIIYTDRKYHLTELSETIKSRIDIPLVLGLTSTPQNTSHKSSKVI